MFLEIFDFFFLFIHKKNFNVFFFFSLLFSPKLELNTNKYGTHLVSYDDFNSSYLCY